MPTTFEEALRSALTNANEGFEAADADLHREVAAAAQALAAVTQGRAKLTLYKSGESEYSVNYSLKISGAGGANDFKELSKISVSAKGYPIRIGTGGPDIVCQDKESLAPYFSNLATNPDSPLVTFAAYIMRKK